MSMQSFSSCKNAFDNFDKYGTICEPRRGPRVRGESSRALLWQTTTRSSSSRATAASSSASTAPISTTRLPTGCCRLSTVTSSPPCLRIESQGRVLTTSRPRSFEDRVRSYMARNIEYQVKMFSLTQKNSTTRQLDVIHHVSSVVVVKWIAQRFALPIKSESRPGGLVCCFSWALLAA